MAGYLEKLSFELTMMSFNILIILMNMEPFQSAFPWRRSFTLKGPAIADAF